MIFPSRTLGPVARAHGAPDPNADLKAIVIAYWKMDEASGDRADSGFSNFTLTDHGVGSASGHVYPLAADFETTESDYLSKASHENLGFEPGRTYAVWFKPESLPPVALVHGHHANNGGAYSIFGHVVNQWHFQTGNGAPNTFVTVAAGGGASIGTNVLAIYWHDQTEDKLFLQINNGPVASSAAPNAPSSYMTLSPTAEFDIGRRIFPGSESYWDGLIGPFAIFDGVLTADQRSRLWNGGAGLALY